MKQVVSENQIAPIESIQAMIVPLRGVQVMLDRDLAELYGVETKRLNEQVRRNIERFPEGFMFQLTDAEFAEWKSQIATSNLKSQIATSNSFKMGLRHRPFAFTEHGITMLASVLKSQTAVQTSIRVVKAFVAMRSFLMSSAGVLQRIGAIEIKQLETDRRMDTVTRMNPSNGLCLSATYDAAFDKHLISFDENYRMILSKSLRDYCTDEIHRNYFLAFEGKTLSLPCQFLPGAEFLAYHRGQLAG